MADEDGVERDKLGRPRPEIKDELGSDRERDMRDQQIAAAADRGIRPNTLAKQFNLSRRSVYRIIQEQRDKTHAEMVSKADPMTFIKETLGQYEAGIEELAMLAANTDHPTVKVAAIRSRIEAVRGRLELLQAVGVVPHNLGTLRVEADAQEVGRAIVDVLEAYETPEQVVDAILAVVEGREVELPAGGLPPG